MCVRARSSLSTNPPPAEVNLNVDVDAGATLLFFNANLASLTIDGSVSMYRDGTAFCHQALFIGPGGKLDLADNDLVLDYDGGSPRTALSNWIASGRADGTWAGFGIVTSESAAQSDLTTLGISEAADALGLAAGDTAVFSGVTVDSTAVLIKYTYGGDANLDGAINADDYAAIDFYQNQPGASGYWNAIKIHVKSPDD